MTARCKRRGGVWRVFAVAVVFWIVEVLLAIRFGVLPVLLGTVVVFAMVVAGVGFLLADKEVR